MPKITVPFEFTKGLNGEEKDNRENEYRNAVHILMILAAKVQKKLDQAIREEEEKERFDHPNLEKWNEDNRGYRRAHREILRLLPDPELVLLEEKEKQNG